MKKIYLLALAVSASVAGVAQQKMSPVTVGKQIDRDVVRVTPAESGERNVIWSNDFSNCDDWTIVNANDAGFGQYIDGINFVCGTEAPSGPAAIVGINSTTADNGFMMVDSDAFGGTTPGNWTENCWFETAAPISLNGLDQVSIRFQTFYRMWDNGSSDGNEYCLVEISTDGVTWPDVTTYEVSEAPEGTRFELWPTMGTQDPVENPTTKVFNLGFIASQPDVDQIWVRFRWKGYWGYAWMVDDVEIFETPDNDLTVNKVWVGNIETAYEYRVVPVSEATAAQVQMGAEIANYGNLDQDAVLTVNIDGVDYTASATILAGTVDTLWTDAFSLPTAPNMYDVTFTVPADEVEAGNMRMSSVEISDLIYGHNSSNPEELFQRTLNNDAEVAMGNLYTFDAEASAGAVQMLFGNGSDVGTECQVFIYEVLTSIQDLSQIAVSLPFVVTQQMIDDGDNQIYTTIPLLNEAANFEAGKSYIAELRRFESTERVFLWSNLNDDDFGTVCFGPFGTGSTTNWFVGWGFTPSVQLVLDPGLVSVENISAGNIENATIFPNPTEENSTVVFNLLNSENVNIIVRDITGRVVATQNYGILPSGQNRMNLNVANLSAGAYSVSLQAGTSVVTSQIVVR